MGFSGLLAEGGKGGDKMLRSVFLLYQEIQIQIAFWHKISYFFNFVWVFEGCFNKYGWHFDDVANLATLDLSKVNDFEIKFLTL